MRDSTFFRGLLLGLLVGFVVGNFLTSAAPSPPGSGTAEVERLRHQLESSRRERDALEKNLDDFRIVAEKMTVAFENLEKRFRALEQAEPGETPTVP
jgi:hypothetical protein